MKLLMITRKVDSRDASPAAFTFTWVKKLSQHLDMLYVITWQEGKIDNLLKNVEIVSLSGNKFKKIFSIQRHLFKILPKVDGVFCHQNPEYTILAAPLAKLFRKKLVTWYTHGTVSLRLKLVNLLTNKILTASVESCRLKDREKIKAVGHGINTEYFKPLGNSRHKGEFIILTAGRISPVKNHKILIRAIEIIKGKADNLEVQIVGEPGLKKQEEYLKELKESVRNKGLTKEIKFLGPVPYAKILPYFQKCDLFVNLSKTGSLDKAVLEAMACQKMVLTSNEAFKNILGQDLMVEEDNSQELAEKIEWAMGLTEAEREEQGLKLREIVVKNHSLDNLAGKIINQFK